MKSKENKKKTAYFKKRYSDDDINFMNSLSQAVLSDNPAKSNTFLYILALVIFLIIAWMNFAHIDERTRGMGKVIPSSQIQVIQNLEGGIVEKILIKEGEKVRKKQILVTIDDTGAGSTFAESNASINELMAKAVRLRAEAGIEPFKIKKGTSSKVKKLIEKEEILYKINIKRKNSEREVLQQRLKQREIELSESQINISSLSKSTKMISREIELTKPLFKKKLVSELEYIQLKQKALEKKLELDSAKKKSENLQSKIIEAKNQINELEERYKSESLEEYNKVIAEIERLQKTQLALEDRVKRTSVRSPVDGTVKRLLINTVGGVIRPGMDILEIVPDEESLLIEAKIKPSDIAFLYPGLKAVVKITAYDFAIYGGLEGKVKHISADTITDEKNNEFYLVRIETDQNFLGTEQNRKNIIVGMTAQVDIITGSKSIMQYLLKPILRAKENALRER
jgi:adhesin transport system membrane fusion protein